MEKIIFTKEECENILEYTKEKEGLPSNPSYRESDYLAWYIYRDEKTEWIFQRIFKYLTTFVKINKELDMLFLQSVKVGNKFEKHTDNSNYFNVGVCLNDDYEGGELYVENSNFTIEKKQGNIYFFEGFKPHGISEVITGQRFTLVGFFRTGDLNFNKKLL